MYLTTVGTESFLLLTMLKFWMANKGQYLMMEEGTMFTIQT